MIELTIEKTVIVGDIDQDHSCYALFVSHWSIAAAIIEES